MTQPQLAPVRPRVVSSETGEVLLLEDALAMLLDAGERGPIEIVGAEGDGKSTALAHLAAVFAERPELVFLDDATMDEVNEHDHRWVIIFTSNPGDSPCTAIKLELAPWSDDEWIEYLLARHPQRCSSVMRRARADDFRHQLLGSPELWRPVLDEFAASDDVPDIRAALRSAFVRLTPSGPFRLAAGGYCVEREFEDAEHQRLDLADWNGSQPALRLLRRRVVRLLLAADGLRCLDVKMLSGFFAWKWPADLISEYALRIAGDSEGIAAVRQLLASDRRHLHCTAASVLAAANIDWTPTADMQLQGALLSGVDWSELDLTDVNLRGAQLTGARLNHATLHHANLRRTRLRQASLYQAILNDAMLHEADLSQANLTEVVANAAQFHLANLSGATLRDAKLQSANLARTDLRGASFQGADLSSAVFREARIEGADFRNADLTGARLARHVLRLANFTGARFGGADLRYCDLETMRLPGADFEAADLASALLTGTQMPGANLRRAVLRNAGVAEVDWEGADLRNADLRGCAFHLGSSRSGLVDSPYPSHGTRTGFYTDTYDDRYHKAPEEIRKANLRGADLRGALITGVDFYLVDLRDALYDSRQAAHFRRCDAILEEVRFDSP